MTITQPTPASPAGLRAGTRGMRAVALGAVVLLGASACGGEEAEPETSPRAGSERLTTAAEAGMERASSYGFDSAGFYTEVAVEEFREGMDRSLAGEEAEVEVSPAACEDPITAVDWAPLLLGEDAARVDFGAESFTGTGSIEIAHVPDEEARTQVAEHMENVAELVASCGEVTAVRDDIEYSFSIEPVELEALDEETTAAYSRIQSLGQPEAEDAEGDDAEEAAEEGADQEAGTIAAQILFTQTDEDVVMVSFIGEPAAASAEFTTMAESITEEVLAALAGDA